MDTAFTKKDGTTGAGIFFHLGKIRRRRGQGMESGFIGFQKKHGGYDFLDLVIDKYQSGEYKKYKRWDDSYLFRKVWDEHCLYSDENKISYRDVVGPNPETSHVVEEGLFADYIEHNKGFHIECGIFPKMERNRYFSPLHIFHCKDENCDCKSGRLL